MNDINGENDVAQVSMNNDTGSVRLIGSKTKTTCAATESLDIRGK